MPGRSLLLRTVLGPVLVVSTIITGFVAVQIMDGFVTGMPAPAASLGWPEFSQIYFIMSLGFVAVILIIFLWLWMGPIQSDVRQGVQGGRRF